VDLSASEWSSLPSSVFDHHYSAAQVDFDTDLDMAPYMSNRRAGSQMYELFGVLVHAGHSVHSGHYYCYVRAPNGLWHHMDDNQVSQVCPSLRSCKVAQHADVLGFRSTCKVYVLLAGATTVS